MVPGIAIPCDEGVGKSYEVRLVSVRLHSQLPTEAFAYFALHTNSTVNPFHWYKEHVIRGATEHGLPDTWLLQQSIPQRASMGEPGSGRLQVLMG